MKSWIPPVVALAVAGAWVAAKQSTITRIERETEILRERVAKAGRAGGEDRDGANRSLAGSMQRDKAADDEIDWEKLATAMAEAQSGGMPDMRSMMTIQRRLMTMEGPELEAALDEIAALELQPEVREMLESMLIGMLTQKEPALVLDRYFEHLHDSRRGAMSWQLASAFQQWLAKDPAAAKAWFEQKVAAGEFESRSLDGKSQSRLHFEAALVAALMESDPAAAGERLESLPEDQRRELFQQGMFMNVKPGSEQAFADLVRKYVPEDERGAAFSQATMMMVHQGGYERVSGFLDGIAATPDERKEIATQVAENKLQVTGQTGSLNREAIDELRAWVSKEAPGSESEVTGKALGNVWGGNFEQKVKLVEELHAEGGGDDLLVGFLNGHQARQNPEEAWRLAGMIEDEQRRKEVLEMLGDRSAADGVLKEEFVRPTATVEEIEGNE